jgi:sugar phosphate isomerase/epimerase
MALLLGGALGSAAEPAPARSGPPFAFFAFDNGAGRNRWSPEQQAATLARLGYDGISYSGLEDLPERLAAFDRQGLRIFNLYVGAKVGPDGPSYDPKLPEALPLLRGRNIALWLYVNGKADDGDAQAVRIVSEVADLAAAHDVRVVLYPHAGFQIATVREAIRVARASARANVGVTFNLCHYLKVEGEPGWREVLSDAMPLLEFVSINGADSGGTQAMGWESLIQPLGSGTFDVSSLLTTLNRLGYRGPVGLQCYNISGDQVENLRRSLQAWRAMRAREALSVQR